jgi:hypothetical protein
VTHLKDKPFALIGIHIGGLNTKRLKEVMEKNKLIWRSFVDAGNAGAGPIATKWNLSATPTFYVIPQRLPCLLAEVSPTDGRFISIPGRLARQVDGLTALTDNGL